MQLCLTDHEMSFILISFEYYFAVQCQFMIGHHNIILVCEEHIFSVTVI